VDVLADLCGIDLDVDFLGVRLGCGGMGSWGSSYSQVNGL
jgi:hypothetical protein